MCYPFYSCYSACRKSNSTNAQQNTYPYCNCFFAKQVYSPCAALAELYLESWAHLLPSLLRQLSSIHSVLLFSIYIHQHQHKYFEKFYPHLILAVYHTLTRNSILSKIIYQSLGTISLKTGVLFLSEITIMLDLTMQCLFRHVANTQTLIKICLPNFSWYDFLWI